MRFTQATLAAFVAATAEARTFAVLRFNGKALTTGRMDPIVNPGAPSGHVHNIQGGNAFKMTMTDDDPLSSTCTTAKIANDHSNYWTPTLFFKDPKTGMLESVELFYMNVYYFFENDNDKVHAFPKGLRMFVGNPSARTPPSTPNNILDTSQGTPQPIQWTCPRSQASSAQRLYPANSNGMDGVGIQDTQNTGAGVGFPDKECDGYASPLRADIHFPSCYDPSKGVRNYKENMQWPSNNKCPTGTIRVPHLFYEVYWDTLKFQNRWTKGQGESPWVLSNGDPTGYSLHGDFINGWDENTLQTIIDTCDAGSVGMDKCPNIPGGLNNDQDCTVPNFVPETVMGVMSTLPGGAKVGNWGEAAAPAPAASSTAAAPSSEAAAPASSSTTKASAPSSTKDSSPTVPSSNAAAPNPSTTLQTTTRAAGQSSAAPNPTAAPEPTEAPSPTEEGETVVTSIVSETTIVYTTVTLAPGATAAPEAISGYSYKGCYSDNINARVLSGLKFANIGQRQVTSTKCVDYCAARGFSIAGTEFGGQCFCGNELVGSKKIDESACKLPCEGDNSEICGGGLALSVYEKTTDAKKRSHKKRTRHVHRHVAHKASH